MADSTWTNLTRSEISKVVGNNSTGDDVVWKRVGILAISIAVDGYG